MSVAYSLALKASILELHESQQCKSESLITSVRLIKFCGHLKGCAVHQGQAKGYGRITRTSSGHYFQNLFTAKPLDIHHFLGYQMKDLDIVFPLVPHNPI